MLLPFFVLSAYLITTLLLKEKERSGRIHVRKFAARRVLRIWPLYALVIFLGWIAGHYYPQTAFLRLKAVAALALVSGNLFVQWHGWGSLGSISPLWSISTEEQFYLVVPGAAKFGGRRALAMLACVSIATSYGVLWFLGKNGADFWQGVWPSSFVQFQFFSAGVLLALKREQRTSRPPSAPKRILLLAAWLLLWTAAVVRLHIGANASVSSKDLCAGFGCVLVGTMCFFFAGLDIRVRIPSFIKYLGIISFGLYAYHGLAFWAIFDNQQAWPATRFFTQHSLLGDELALAATFAAAGLSYRYFEEPFLRLKRRFEVIRTGQ